MQINTVGIVGAGVMGSGVAHAFAERDFEVILVDNDGPALDSARQCITDLNRLKALLAKQKSSMPIGQPLAKVTFTTDYQALAGAPFVIENVPENWDIKSVVYRRLGSVCARDCIFGVNTSAISITRVAALLEQPCNVVGIHFMNPVPLKHTVEVIRGHYTSDATISSTIGLLSRIGKQAVVVKDSPGFVSNRVLMLTINEAVFLLQEDVATAPDVDRIFRECFEHKMGPLETADLIGLDTILLSIDVLYDSFKDSKFRACPLLRRMVSAGLLGRKSGEGFYRYGAKTS